MSLFLLQFWKRLGNQALAGWSWLTRGGWKSLAAVLTIALAVFLIHQAREARQERDTARAALTQANQQIEVLTAARAADSKATTSRTARHQEIEKREHQDSKRTEAALAAHRDWADQPVPADVLDSLQ